MSTPTKIVVSGDNDLPIAILNIPAANALDVLHFIQELIDLIGLEQLAQKEGRTFNYPLAGSIGARPVGAVAWEGVGMSQKPPQRNPANFFSDVEGDTFAGIKPAVARTASQVNASVQTALLQHRLDPLIEAKLAKVVHGLRTNWIAHIAGFWGDIHPIDKSAISDLDKRVATALREGFFHFSQLLCGFELLLLKSKELGVVPEESVLGLEKLVVELGNNRSNFVKVPDPERCLPEFLGGRDCTDGGRND